MRRSRPQTKSLADLFWEFLRDDPELARMIAFEVGSLAGNLARLSVANKKYLKNQAKKVPQAISDTMPAGLSSALKLLPAPRLQPAKRTQVKRSSRRRTKHAA